MAPQPASPVGVLLLNVGTPAAPRTREVRRYLREFLMDPRVIDLSPLARWLLVHLVILPRRPRLSAHAYASIWAPEGSPLLVESERLRERVQAELGEGYVVRLAMRYGEPSIAGAVRELAAAGVRRVVALPMFPQHAEATRGSALARLHEVIERGGAPMEVVVSGTFYDAPGFIECVAEAARPRLEAFAPDHVLFSYHGLPERHVRRADASGAHCLASADCCERIGPVNRDCYRAHCHHTTRALVRALGLAPDRYTMSFQSRLGRERWIAPYTDAVVPELAARGLKRLAVLCPAFVADCLETLEEIGVRARDQWRALGGEELLLVPALNGDAKWAREVATMVRGAAGRVDSTES